MFVAFFASHLLGVCGRLASLLLFYFIICTFLLQNGGKRRRSVLLQLQLQGPSIASPVVAGGLSAEDIVMVAVIWRHVFVPPPPLLGPPLAAPSSRIV